MISPRVSVLVGTHNRPKELTRCLQSILALDYDEFEIIVVDNGSDQFTVPDLEYTRPVSFYSAPIAGLSRARNFALTVAQHSIIGLVDDDAIVDSAWLRQATGHFLDSSVGCVTGRILPLNPEGEWQGKLLSTGWFPIHTDLATFDRSNFHPLKDSPGTGSNVLLRKEALGLPGFPETFGPGTPVRAADENYFFHQIIRNGWRIVYEPGALVLHEFPNTREAYRTLMFRHGISRGAFLTEFLLFQKGMRKQTFQHLLSSTLSGETHNGPRSWSRIAGLMAGAVAIFHSKVRTSYLKPGTPQLVAKYNR